MNHANGGTSKIAKITTVLEVRGSLTLLCRAPSPRMNTAASATIAKYTSPTTNIGRRSTNRGAGVST